MIIPEGKKHLFIVSDCLKALKEMPSDSVNCIITSPPYWGMRIYDNAENENEIGNEKDFKEYVAKLTIIFNEARRVLANDGSLWLNLGDKYNNKALMGMPWRVALALIDDSWILRNDVIWNQLKGTQSCKDRLRDSYEHHSFNSRYVMRTLEKTPIEIFGHDYTSESPAFALAIRQQYCKYLKSTCSKPRKSQPEIKVGICTLGATVCKSRDILPVIVCPDRFKEDSMFESIREKWTLTFNDISSTSIEGINRLPGGAPVNEYLTEEEFIRNIVKKGIQDKVLDIR